MNFWAISFLCGGIRIFVKKGLPKLSFRMASYFPVIWSFAKFFFIFHHLHKKAPKRPILEVDLYFFQMKLYPVYFRMG